MARGQLQPAIRQLLRLVSARRDGGLTDGQLLERFARQRDEAAFETLLWRHGLMVLRTCQRVLRCPQDAEDAFQATFLVLCRKASAVSNRDSVGGWLHKVAYRIALRARATAARHAAEGGDMRGVPAPEAASGPGADDLRPVLDEELSRLPEKYRLPLVLHYLEGKTVQQVAAELGWRPGTVSGRLARAKQLLRPRLARRRVVAGAILAGPAATAAEAEACPAALVEATLKATSAFSAGAGPLPTGISTRAVLLARAALRGMFLARLKLAVAVIVLLGVAAIGAGLRERRSPASSSTPAPPPVGVSDAAPSGSRKAPAQEGTRRLSVSGRVVDADGIPVPGARVDLREWAVWRRQGDVKDIFATTAADADGRFTFRDVAAPAFPGDVLMRLHPWDVVARAEGRGVAWQHLTPKARKSPVTLTLARERVIEGRLLNPAGGPVAGALVRVVAVAPLRHAPVTTWTVEEGILNLNWSEISLTASTDPGGRFVLRGLPPEMRFNVSVGAPGYAECSCLVASTDQAQPNVLNLESSATSKPRVEPVLTGSPTLTLQPTRQVRGRVLLADTRRPAAGAFVWVYVPDGPVFGATTDAEGKFTLAALPPGPWDVAVKAGPADSEYVSISIKVDAAGGEDAAEQSILLPRGTPVNGRVVDAETGQGIAAVCVSYEVGGSTPCHTGPQTEGDGAFRILVPEGRWSLVAHGDTPDYPQTAEQSVTVQPGKPLEGLTIRMRRGLTVKGRVLDPGGSPVAGAEVQMEPADRPGSPVRPRVTDAEGTFTWSRLEPDRAYACTVLHRPMGLGARVVMQPSGAPRTAALAICLQPLGAVAGRVVDDDGRPLADAVLHVRTYLSIPKRDTQPIQDQSEELATDAQGRFRAEGLLPAADDCCALEVSAEGCAGLVSAPFNVPAGQTRTLPDLVLPRADARVSGIVVDAAGRPLADCQVTARPRAEVKNGGELSSPGAVVTAADGRFVIGALPRGPVDVEAVFYEAGHDLARGEQRPASRVRAEAGQGDVRVALPIRPAAPRADPSVAAGNDR
jgi:RNA polymerase sigma factor (sigma-70 family)